MKAKEARDKLEETVYHFKEFGLLKDIQKTFTKQNGIVRSEMLRVTKKQKNHLASYIVVIR